MKLSAFITLSALSLVLTATPTLTYAKEGQSQSRSAVVGSKGSHHGSKGSSRHHSVGPKYHNGHKYKHKSYKHKSYKHHGHRHRHYKRHSWGSFVLGAAIGHSVGIHGSWYRGHPWCPTHRYYHTHSHVVYNDHYYHNSPRKIASYIELNEDGRCFRVSEYSNGDERRKRIRDHHCAEIEPEWDEWDDIE